MSEEVSVYLVIFMIVIGLSWVMLIEGPNSRKVKEEKLYDSCINHCHNLSKGVYSFKYEEKECYCRGLVGGLFYYYDEVQEKWVQ